MSFSGSTNDIVAIRNLIDSYGDAVIRRDLEAFGACWHEAAVWEYEAGRFIGKESILRQWKLIHDGSHGVRGVDTRFFSSAPGAINVGATSGAGQTYITIPSHDMDSDEHVSFHGVYDDEWVKPGGRWLFSSRRFRHLYSRFL
jgi:hypothetical protein